MYREYQYYRSIFQSTPKPFAFVDLDYFDENIRKILARAGNKRIRMASKSVRCVKLMERIMESDKQFQGLMAYNVEEAVFLSQKGFDDILVAYPFWDESHIEHVIVELKRGKTIVAMLDCQEHLYQFSRIAEKHKVDFPLCLDVDMSSDFFGLHFGVYRSGISTEEQVQRIITLIQEQPNLRLEGLMGYEAQIAGLQDHVKGRTLLNLMVPRLKARSIPELRSRRKSVVGISGSVGLRFVNAGGTGSLETSIQEPWVTEVTVGSGFYSPTIFDGYSNFKHLPAAAFAIEITRRPKPHLFTCLGGGYIASGPAGADKLPKPYLPEGVKLVSNEGVGEVQTPVWYNGSESLDLGDPIFFRHAKAGELCERFNQLYLVSEGRIVDVVPTYRGEGMCFM